MSVSLVTVAIVFVAIFPVELPDKTFIATLVLATRYRPLLVWIGVTSAFLVQTVVAVTFGGLLAQLPRTPVEVAAALLFLVGGIILLRGVSDADEEETQTEAEFASKGAAGATGIRAVATCFTVLFLAEWGDLSQLLTASLAMRYDDPCRWAWARSLPWPRSLPWGLRSAASCCAGSGWRGSGRPAGRSACC